MTTELDNKTLEWAAEWIEGSLKGEPDQRVREFGRNMAMTLRAARVRADSGGGGDLISRAEAKKAMCSRCARPERYRPAEPIEGSTRLFHFQIADNWNSGSCDAQVLDSVPTAVAEPTESQVMQNICYAYRQAALAVGELVKHDAAAWALLGQLEEAVKAAEAVRPIYPPAQPTEPEARRKPDLINRQEVIDWLAHRCDYAPPCGKCAYCRIAYAISVWSSSVPAAGPVPPAGLDVVREAAREIAANYEVHKDYCHSNERYPSPRCNCGVIADLEAVITKHLGPREDAEKEQQ